jgi:hypothetical protein
VNHARMGTVTFVILASLAGVAGCSSAASTVTMPPEGHRLPTVLGPLQGSGNKTFTVVVRPTMSVELGCLGKAKDLAWVQSPIAYTAVPCGSSDNQPFGGSYDSVQGLRREKVTVGQRVIVRVTAPAGDTWQLWITGGPPDSLP